VTLFATDVFTPNDFPEHTYIGRDGERLERALRDAFHTPKVVVSISGPSKSGKTVLVEKVVGADSLITVSGAEISSGEDLWVRALTWMGGATSVTTQTGSSKSHQAGGETSAKGSVLVAEASGKASYQHTAGSTESRSETKAADGLVEIVKEIGGSDFVVFLDDFHYIPTGTQPEVARQIKAAGGTRSSRLHRDRAAPGRQRREK
jgi:hypothetical protein